MYNPTYNRVDDPAVALDLIEQVGFGHVVSFGIHGFNSSALPLLVDRDAGRFGSLRGHYARANSQWKRVDATDVFVLFPLADGYVSPAWYPSKAEHGKVVPTWNYEVVHVHGVARVHDDAEWVRQMVTDLTERHESSRTEQAGAPPWAVTDAPDDYIEAHLKGIVGLEIEITAIEAKRKLSQNRSAADVQGVVDGLTASVRQTDNSLGETMRSSPL